MSSRILIVDDEPSIRKVLSAQLKRLGHVVDSCKDGAVAIEKLRRSLVDLVITDLRMPNVDGLELLSHIIERYPGLPVVMITAHGTVDSAVEAIKAGAFDYVSKPFDQEELRDIVRKAIATRSANARHQLPIAGSKYGMVGTSEAMQDRSFFIDKITTLEILRPDDSEEDSAYITDLFHELLGVLTFPFHNDTFDFSDELFWVKVAHMSERLSQDDKLKKLNGNRWSKHFLYINRTFFGLYNLLHDLKADIVVNNYKKFI